MQNSRIEWTDHTFNPWIGCTKVSPGCDHCYAEREMHRFGKDAWGQGKPRQRTAAGTWAQPWKWDKAAAKNGRRDRVFCASLADILDPEVPIEWLSDLLELIDGCRNLDWLLLTKRPHLFGERTDVNFMEWPHVWLGTSIDNQEEADRRLPSLLQIPAQHRFLSCEPLLGPVDLRLDRRYDPTELRLIDWIIVGGESGPQARPTHPDWVYGLRDQSQEAGIPFFFKQWGEWAPWDDDNWLLPAGADDVLSRDHAITIDRVEFLKVGKKSAGRILDGRIWDEIPSPLTSKETP
jgi:protein gp37